MTARIAVTGATGRVGSVVLAELTRRGHHDLVAISRTGGDPASEGPVRPARADYGDPASLERALRGVETLVFISSDGESPQVLVHHHNVVQAAAASKVGHVVALSSLDASIGSPFAYAVTNGLTEAMLEAAGFGAVTIARASIFSEFFAQWPLAARQSGEIRLPADAGRVSLVGRDDVSRTLAALADRPAEGIARFDLTGPVAHSLSDVAALASERFGRPILYVAITPQQFRQQMADDGLEAWWAYAYSTMFDSIRHDSWSTVSTAVLDHTGREPTSFADLLEPEPRRS